MIGGTNNTPDYSLGRHPVGHQLAADEHLPHVLADKRGVCHYTGVNAAQSLW
jgi:hypothetical protein